MNEMYPTPDRPTENIVQFPVRSAYEEGVDAYSDLGGGLQPFRQPETLPVHRNLSFFDIYEQTPDNAWQVDVTRAYDLALNDTLKPEHIAQLAKKDAETLAVAVDNLHSTLCHRAPLLMMEGNYENPAFEKYHFQSQEQAAQYAGVLYALRDSLDEQPVVQQLLAMHREQYLHKRIPQRKRDEARQLKRVIVAEDDSVTLEYIGPTHHITPLRSV